MIIPLIYCFLNSIDMSEWEGRAGGLIVEEEENDKSKRITKGSGLKPGS